MPHGGTIINFPGQETDEQVYIFVRRYPLAFLPAFALILLIITLGLTMIFFIGINDFISWNIRLLLGSAFLLFMMFFTLIEFIDFYFDLNIVTDRRIVDIDQHRLFNRGVSELLLEDVQDVEARTKGFLATLFDFGDVYIQTAGAKPNFTFNAVRHPNEIGAIILDLSDQVHRGVPLDERHPEGSIAAIIDNQMLPHTPNHLNEIP